MATKQGEKTEILSFTQKGLYDYEANEDHDFVTPIYTLFLNESSLVVRSKRKTQGRRGGHFYKSLGSWTYAAKTNKHGEKYLRALRTTGTGVTLSAGPKELFTSDLYSCYSEESPYCDEMIQVIEEHMSKLLGFKFTYGSVPDEDDPESGRYSPDFLCFPFYREKTNKEFIQRILKANRKPNTEVYGIQDDFKLSFTGTRGIYQALRNSNTQDEVISNIAYKSYVKTKEDIRQIIDSPELLSLFSRIDLRITATEAVNRDLVDVFQNYGDYMTISEFYSFKFMVSNVPKPKVSEVLDLAVRLADFRKGKELKTRLKAHIKELDRFSYGSSCNGHDNSLRSYFQQVPPKDRQKFAVTFWEEFRKGYLESERNFLPYSEWSKEDRSGGRKVGENFIKVFDVHMNTYASIYLASAPLKGKESCLNAAMELFGQDLSQYQEIVFDTAKVEELNLSIEHVSFLNLSYSTNGNLLSLCIHNDETKKFFNDAMIFSPIKHMFVEHLNVPNFSGVLISDLEQILRKIAGKIDLELLRLGQPLTVQNRIIYLQSTAKDRKFKINWKFYSLGVNPDEVSTYRAAGIRTKKDILFWVETKQSVPTEMYQELLKDAAYGPTPQLQSNTMLSPF